MTTIIGLTTSAGAGSGAVTANTIAASTAPLPPVNTSTASETATLAAPKVSISSPRTVIDPSAGVVLQYLNADGTFVSQTPSSTVVAYLRAGLTPDGLSKPQAVSENATGAVA